MLECESQKQFQSRCFPVLFLQVISGMMCTLPWKEENLKKVIKVMEKQLFWVAGIGIDFNVNLIYCNESRDV